MTGLSSDIRAGFRALTRKPATTLVAVATLALGIGATSAIFSVVDAVLVRNLPYPDADRLVLVWSTFASMGGERGGTALPDYRAWRDEGRAFDKLGAFYYRDVNLAGAGEEPAGVQAAAVTASLFPTLGIAPALGRGFVADDETFGRHYSAILSHRLWRTRFHGDPAIIGRAIQIGGYKHTIVGVMPDVPFMDQIPRVDLWLPLSFASGDSMDSRGNHFVYVVGRLAAGASAAHADAEVAAITRRIAERFPENTGVGAMAVPMAAELSAGVRPALLVLFGAVALLLLVACVNVANLLLARAVGREREMAIRASLGATRLRLLRMAFVESLFYALAGAAAGLLLAWWGLEAVSALLPESLPRYNAIGVDGRVLAFTLALSVVTVVAFGTFPALQLARGDVGGRLKEAGRVTDGRRRRTLRGVLVAAETALALVLLVGAGLLLRSFVALRGADPGFVAENMVAVRISLTEARYPTPAAGTALFATLSERLRALPDVRAVGMATGLPLDFGAGWEKYLAVDSAAPPASLADLPSARFALADHDYFRAIGTPIRRGRPFAPDENERTPPVAIVNETLARRFLGDEPVGRWLSMCPPASLAPGGGDCPRRQVVGVVADSATGQLGKPPGPQAFVPYRQNEHEGWMSELTVVVRTRGAPTSVLPSVRAVLHAIDPDQPIAEIVTGEELRARSLSLSRFSMILLGLFAALAAMLAGVGIYGVVSYLTAQRTREIGVRLALGAQPRDVVALVLREGMAMTLAGVAVGLAGALALARLVHGLLYGVTPSDPATFVVVTIPLVALALVACWIPARRAARTDPMRSLRQE
jgi:putative ABC transport system permease protein